MLRVYIASPYTIGDKDRNVYRQIRMAESLARVGFLPCWPLSSHFWHQRYPHDHEFWMNLDHEEIKRCDALIRLEGESKGADQEVEWANELGVPVFHSVLGLVEWSQRPWRVCTKCHCNEKNHPDYLCNANYTNDDVQI